MGGRRDEDRVGETERRNCGNHLIDVHKGPGTAEGRRVPSPSAGVLGVNAARGRGHSAHVVPGRHTAIRAGCGAQLAASCKRIRAAGRPVLPHGMTRAQVPDALEIAAPTLRPGETGQEQEEREERDVDSGDCVYVLPEHPAAAAKPRVKNTGQTVRVARPPQEKACHDHDDSPARRELHNPRTVFADEQFSMQPRHEGVNAVVLVIYLQDRKGLGMNIDAELCRAFIDKDLCGGAWCVR